MAKSIAQTRRDQTFTVMARIHRDFNKAKAENYTQKDIMQLRHGLIKYVNELATERDRQSCRTMIDAILHNQSAYDQALVYIFNGKKYSTHKNTPKCEPNGTEDLHDMRLGSEVWDNMEKCTVWQHSGEFYCWNVI